MSYTPDQGDIVSLDFDPSAGREIMKTRPALVISKRIVNNTTGFAILVPITSTERGQNLEVALDNRVTTSGVVVTPQVRSLDFVTRKVRFIEKAPDDILIEVVGKIHLLTAV